MACRIPYILAAAKTNQLAFFSCVQISTGSKYDTFRLSPRALFTWLALIATRCRSCTSYCRYTADILPVPDPYVTPCCVERSQLKACYSAVMTVKQYKSPQQCDDVSTVYPSCVVSVDYRPLNQSTDRPTSSADIIVVHFYIRPFGRKRLALSRLR